MSHTAPSGPSSSGQREPHDLNWLGTTVYVGGTMLRAAANAVEATAERVSQVAAASRTAFERELDPNIEEARVLAEYPDREKAPQDSQG
jgi:hypothetical protein